jgi:hypothetical protein
MDFAEGRYIGIQVFFADAEVFNLDYTQDSIVWWDTELSVESPKIALYESPFFKKSHNGPDTVVYAAWLEDGRRVHITDWTPIID